MRDEQALEERARFRLYGWVSLNAERASA
jgi:hypothetical protein